MFGIGPSELVIVFLAVLLLFGPNKLPQMARDVGRFVTEARRSIDEFKDELTSSVEDEDEEDRHYRRRKQASPAKRTEKREKDKEDDPSSGEEEEYDF